MTSRFLPDVAEAPPAKPSLFIRCARVFILVGVWVLVILEAIASWLITAR